MIRSMTGYGEASGNSAAGLLRVEIRSVNHRFFHFTARMPTVLARWEAEVREWLRAEFARGHVSCAIRLEAAEAEPIPLRLDAARVEAYLAMFRELGERFGVAGTPDLATISRFSDILVRDESPDVPVSVEADDLRPVVHTAALQVIGMREEEGRRLQADLEERLMDIDCSLGRIADRAPDRLLAERDRLRTAVRELSDGIGISEDRLAQEIALLAERWDINEELVRFRAHNAAFRVFLASPADEPVGKRLAFLVQEMHREANTIGSKANDAAIAHEVVSIKEAIERLREQVENVE